MDGVKNLLEKLPTMFTDTREVSSCLGTALGASFQVIKAIGGKIVLFTGLLPAESPASEVCFLCFGKKRPFI
jgi:protein transport protein SEC24